MVHLLEESERSPTRKRLTLAFRILVSAGMLAFLVWKIEAEGVGDMIPAWTARHPRCGWPAPSASPWPASCCRRCGGRSVLHALGPAPPAAAPAVAVPGRPVRGQRPAHQHRGRRAAGHPPVQGTPVRAHTSFASVVLERMTGWIVLPAITFAGLAANPGLFRQGPRAGADRGRRSRSLVLVLLGGVLFAVARHDYAAQFDEPKGWRRFLAAVSFGLHRLRRHPAEVAQRDRRRLRSTNVGPGAGCLRRRPRPATPGRRRA